MQASGFAGGRECARVCVAVGETLTHMHDNASNLITFKSACQLRNGTMLFKIPYIFRNDTQYTVYDFEPWHIRSYRT